MKCGDDPESDVAFHFNPRFGEEQCTVRNTYVDGNWQDEERDEESFPFEKKDTFEVVIRVMEDKFVVGLRHKHYKISLVIEQYNSIKMHHIFDFPINITKDCILLL